MAKHEEKDTGVWSGSGNGMTPFSVPHHNKEHQRIYTRQCGFWCTVDACSQEIFCHKSGVKFQKCNPREEEERLVRVKETRFWNEKLSKP